MNEGSERIFSQFFPPTVNNYGGYYYLDYIAMVYISEPCGGVEREMVFLMELKRRRKRRDRPRAPWAGDLKWTFVCDYTRADYCWFNIYTRNEFLVYGSSTGYPAAWSVHRRLREKDGIRKKKKGRLINDRATDLLGRDDARARPIPCLVFTGDTNNAQNVLKVTAKPSQRHGKATSSS